jgi:7-cyano-7-deazaguanine synthase in queuosine biosynthesis
MILTRGIPLKILTLLLVTACAGERSVAPGAAENTVMAQPAVGGRTVAVGNEVLLWISWSIEEGSQLEVIVTGRAKAEASVCPDVSYAFDGVIQQASGSGSTNSPGADKLRSAESFPSGTRLRFIRYVATCESVWNAYAFEVISLPGK